MLEKMTFKRPLQHQSSTSPQKKSNGAASSASRVSISSSRLSSPTKVSTANNSMLRAPTPTSSVRNSQATQSNLPVPSRGASVNDRTPTKANQFAVKRVAKAQSSSDNEPLKAYLRIRPASRDDSQQQQEPYIEVVNETDVLMNPPKDAASAARARIYAASVPTKYTFSRVFGPSLSVKEDAQTDFFRHTTLPLVDELLQGQSGLIFTYGVTNSGKSYTVQGEPGPGQSGILPRSADVVFNSIQGLQSSSDIRPVGLSGVERARPSDSGSSSSGGSEASTFNPLSLPGMSKRLAATNGLTSSYEYDTTTKVRVDRNYRYSVWVSYVEVYNEKIFDLLDVAAPPAPTQSSGLTASFSAAFGLSRSDSHRGSNWALASGSGTGGAGSSDPSSPIYLQRKPLSLKNDIEAGGKYVAGLQEIRVRTSAEARELMRRGQENRRVFATMANRASSRSHGVFTLKVIREHSGEESGSMSCMTSRLSIIDLAGSERLGNTSATGDRLKEAGSINKSLMCLGQCIETLRKNQSRAASFIPAPVAPVSSTANGTSSNTAATNVIAARVIKRRPSIVPFRHSKLTELFQSFFTGEGRAVMIVNVNPYDTGFDENSHVMRFSAAAKEVHTVRTQAQATNLTRFVHPSLRNLFNGQGNPLSPPSRKTGRTSDVSQPSCPPTPKASNMAPPSLATKKTASVTALSKTPTESIATSQRADRSVQAVEGTDREVTIIEGSDEEDEDGENDSDPFVEHLMQRYEQLREQLFESEMRCATIERQVREEMAEEMAQQLQEMQELYSERMLQDAQHNEEFVNRKLDLLARASGYRSSVGNETEDCEYESAEEDDEEEEEDLQVEQALATDGQQPDQSADCSQSSASTAVDDASVVYKVARIRTTRRIEESDDEEEEVGEDESAVDENRLEGEIDESTTSIDLPSRLLDRSASLSSADVTRRSEDISSALTEEGEDDDDGESEEEEEDEETSDESFDVTTESIESSFEAAPRARASRARASVAASRTNKTRGARATTMTASKARKEPTTRRRTTAAASSTKGNAASSTTKQRQPFGRSSAANTSQEVNSDASLILTSASKKSPKKRLLGRKTIMDEETMIERTGDSSLVAEI